jgi:hypothetical protein
MKYFIFLTILFSCVPFSIPYHEDEETGVIKILDRIEADTSCPYQNPSHPPRIFIIDCYKDY